MSNLIQRILEIRRDLKIMNCHCDINTLHNEGGCQCYYGKLLEKLERLLLNLGVNK